MEPRVVHAKDSRRISLYDVTFRYGIGADESARALLVGAYSAASKTAAIPCPTPMHIVARP